MWQYSWQRTGLLVFYAVLLLVWIPLWLSVPQPLQVLAEYWHFLFLGVSGAVAANATGAGGGVVFIPAFTSLGISSPEALGTSIAIQCFGMSVGSITWLISLQDSEHSAEKPTRLAYRLIFYSGVPAILGILCGQYIFPEPTLSITTIFRSFSIFFGIALFIVTLHKHPRQHTRYSIKPLDVFLIVVTGFLGGAVTSWISVGAGEWIALLLFFLGYPTMISVCVAVCITALTVLAGVIYHLLIIETISWNILLFAAPAAMIGGSVARLLAEKLGPIRLKIFFATWLLATGIAMG